MMILTTLQDNSTTTNSTTNTTSYDATSHVSPTCQALEGKHLWLDTLVIILYLANTKALSESGIKSVKTAEISI